MKSIKKPSNIEVFRRIRDTRDHAARGITRAAPLGIAAALLSFACSDPGIADDGSIRGTLDVYIANYDDGTSSKLYSLRRPDGRNMELRFTSAPEAEVGDALRVWGVEQDGRIVVDSYQVEPPVARDLGVVRSPLVDAPPDPPRTFAFVLVTANGVTPQLTVAQAEERVISGSTSFVRYYLENSYGIQSFEAEIFSGPQFTHTMNGCSFNETDRMADSLRDAVDDAAGHSFDHYGFYFEGENTGCNWSGLGQVGRPNRPARDSWYRASSGCVVLAQEVGHNLAQAHSSALDCGSSSYSANPASCRHIEYGDRFDVMGGGCYHWTMYHKVHWNWARNCNSVKVTSSGTFDVFPIETPCDGIQTLQIPMPMARPFPQDGDNPPAEYYYVEYRQPVGNFSQPRGNLHSGVLIHAGTDYQQPNQYGDKPYLLDMTPGSQGDDRRDFEDAALTVGKTFEDPSGSPRITLLAADSTKATVQIEIDNGSGFPTCLDGMELQAPGPQSCGEPPQPPMGGSGGTGGSAGSTSVGGTGGSGGLPGTGGTGDTGGTGGSAGGLGVGGSAGTGGGSTGGTPAVGGSPALGGSAGVSAGGLPAVGGSPSVAGGPSSEPSAQLVPADQVLGQCACRVPGGMSKTSGAPFGLAAFGLVALMRRRRNT